MICGGGMSMAALTSRVQEQVGDLPRLIRSHTQFLFVITSRGRILPRDMRRREVIASFGVAAVLLPVTALAHERVWCIGVLP